jgi:hypothetical protein
MRQKRELHQRMNIQKMNKIEEKHQGQSLKYAMKILQNSSEI